MKRAFFITYVICCMCQASYMSTTLPGIRVTAECDLDWFCKADKEGVEAGGDASEAQPVALPTEPELSGPTPDLSTPSSFGYFRSG